MFKPVYLFILFFFHLLPASAPIIHANHTDGSSSTDFLNNSEISPFIESIEITFDKKAEKRLAPKDLLFIEKRIRLVAQHLLTQNSAGSASDLSGQEKAKMLIQPGFPEKSICAVLAPSIISKASYHSEKGFQLRVQQVNYSTAPLKLPKVYIKATLKEGSRGISPTTLQSLLEHTLEKITTHNGAPISIDNQHRFLADLLRHMGLKKATITSFRLNKITEGDTPLEDFFLVKGSLETTHRRYKPSAIDISLPEKLKHEARFNPQTLLEQPIFGKYSRFPFLPSQTFTANHLEKIARRLSMRAHDLGYPVKFTYKTTPENNSNNLWHIQFIGKETQTRRYVLSDKLVIKPLFNLIDPSKKVPLEKFLIEQEAEIKQILGLKALDLRDLLEIPTDRLDQLDELFNEKMGVSFFRYQLFPEGDAPLSFSNLEVASTEEDNVALTPHLTLAFCPIPILTDLVIENPGPFDKAQILKLAIDLKLYKGTPYTKKKEERLKKVLTNILSTYQENQYIDQFDLHFLFNPATGLLHMHIANANVSPLIHSFDSKNLIQELSFYAKGKWPNTYLLTSFSGSLNSGGVWDVVKKQLDTYNWLPDSLKNIPNKESVQPIFSGDIEFVHPHLFYFRTHPVIFSTRFHRTFDKKKILTPPAFQSGLSQKGLFNGYAYDTGLYIRRYQPNLPKEEVDPTQQLGLLCRFDKNALNTSSLLPYKSGLQLWGDPFQQTIHLSGDISWNFPIATNYRLLLKFGGGKSMHNLKNSALYAPIVPTIPPINQQFYGIGLGFYRWKEDNASKTPTATALGTEIEMRRLLKPSAYPYAGEQVSSIFVAVSLFKDFSATPRKKAFMPTAFSFGCHIYLTDLLGNLVPKSWVVTLFWDLRMLHKKLVLNRWTFFWFLLPAIRFHKQAHI